MRLTALVLVLVLAAVACSGDEASTATDATAAPTPTTSVDPEPTLTIANLNLLHGLPLGNCPPETAGCQAEARLGLVWQAVEDASCPDVLTFQEVGPDQQTMIPDQLPEVCDGSYVVASVTGTQPVEQWILTSLPVLGREWEPITGLSRTVQLVGIDSAIGPVDVVTTHFVAGIDNFSCAEIDCNPICDEAGDAGDCNPLEVLDFLERRGTDDRATVVTGDLNAEIDDPRIAPLLEGGFVDAWTAAGNPECDQERADSCSCCVEGDGPYEGLDDPEQVFDSRIDFILVRRTADCGLIPATPIGGGSGVRPFASGPTAEPADGIYWASDHDGVQAELRCS